MWCGPDGLPNVMMRKEKKGKDANDGASAPVNRQYAEAIDSLTIREREVFGWLVEGKRNAEIASILGISVHTVHKHVHRILEKLDVETRTAAVRVGVRGGVSGGK